jgi:phage terminase large subunit-like protein
MQREWGDQLWNWKWFGKNHKKRAGRSTGMRNRAWVCCVLFTETKQNGFVVFKWFWCFVLFLGKIQSMGLLCFIHRNQTKWVCCVWMVLMFCLVSRKNTEHGFGFAVFEWFWCFVWFLEKIQSMGCSKLNKINREKNTANYITRFMLLL